MPGQRQIDEIKAAHLASIQEVMARYPGRDNPAVLLDDMGTVLVSPFGPVPHTGSTPLPVSPAGSTQQSPSSYRPDSDTANPGLGPSMLMLLAGLYGVYAYIRKLLE